MLLALGAIAVQFVAPDSFTIFLSIAFLVGIVVGGLASVSGAIYGALFIQFIPNIADQISKAAPWAIYGVFLIGFMYLMPTGVAGLVRRAQHLELVLERKRALVDDSARGAANQQLSAAGVHGPGLLRSAAGEQHGALDGLTERCRECFSQSSNSAITSSASCWRA